MAFHSSIPQGTSVGLPKAVPAARWEREMPIARMTKKGVSASSVDQRESFCRCPYAKPTITAIASAPTGSNKSMLREIILSGLSLNAERLPSTKSRRPPRI